MIRRPFDNNRGASQPLRYTAREGVHFSPNLRVPQKGFAAFH
uniref:Uncharacterized protein n=1 Tax=Candidatus Kentrum sp. MB TaxID=2138164 RepID=A0A450XDX1_9GAMM|nr:MAG: hypothetical protein BECKMB1821G_GA0114241_102819 [Candidatus Kentron sp. MB]VFK32049.1 MAG: hypothetical protein BECKMB1821I_GA0114274_102918 [Candidatus Kentron sp. MB]VFK75666.1 MAG: hypothetical protein BECKMB1821H_GA0114242_102830 [Candidatus Kentron sp. MB]